MKIIMTNKRMQSAITAHNNRPDKSDTLILDGFDMTKVDWSVFSKIDHVRFHNCLFSHSIVDVPLFAYCTFSHCSMRRVRFDAAFDTCRFTGCDMTEVNLSNGDLPRCYLSNCKLYDAVLCCADLDTTEFRNCFGLYDMGQVYYGGYRLIGVEHGEKFEYGLMIKCGCRWLDREEAETHWRTSQSDYESSNHRRYRAVEILIRLQALDKIRAEVIRNNALEKKERLEKPSA